MRAVVYDEYGSADVLRVEDVPTPTLTDDGVLVQVRATSVNSWDWDLIGGDVLGRLAGGLRKPRRRIPGIDVVGTVVRSGPDASLFAEGDEVFGDLSGVGFGAFAEFVVAPERVLAPKSPSLTFEQAAAVPHAGLLALQSLRGKRPVQPGDRVLINGAGGGVGSFGIPLARMMGAEVTGVDAEAKFDVMRSFGAEHVIDYRAQDFTKQGERYDVILDVTSRRSVIAYRRALEPGGAAVLVGGSIPALLGTATIGALLSRTTDERYSVLVHRPNRDDLAELNRHIEAGTVTPVIDSVWPLEEISEAVALVGRSEAKGKVIVTV